MTIRLLLSFIFIISLNYNSYADSESYGVPDGVIEVEGFYNHPTVKLYYNIDQCGGNTSNKINYYSCGKDTCLELGFEWITHEKCVTPLEKEFINICNELGGAWSYPYRETINHSDYGSNCSLSADDNEVSKLMKEQNIKGWKATEILKKRKYDVLTEIVDKKGDYIIEARKRMGCYAYSKECRDLNEERWKIQSEYNEIRGQRAENLIEEKEYAALEEIFESKLKKYDEKAEELRLRCNNNKKCEKVFYNLYDKEECKNLNGEWLTVKEAKKFSNRISTFGLYLNGECKTPRIPEESELKKICEEEFLGKWGYWGFAQTPACTHY